MADDATPVGAFHFQVHIAEIGPRGGARRTIELDVQQVVLPTFVGRTTERPTRDPAGDDADRLVLRRGHTGSSYFYDWWEQERNPKYKGSRAVGVTLLDRDLRPATIWRFTGCRLASFAYSPLDALESAVLMETAAIEFESVAQATPRASGRRDRPGTPRRSAR